MGSIGANTRVEVGVATSNGKAYYRITSFLKSFGVPYGDVVLGDSGFAKLYGHFPQSEVSFSDHPFRVIITTRGERLQLAGDNVLCIEDLGEDHGLAMEKLLSALYPVNDEADAFLIGIDPGQRTGVAAFINHREIESLVLPSLNDTVERVRKLLDNAPRIRKIVRIGYGNPKLAMQIARRLDSNRYSDYRIQFVDERGTSALDSRRNLKKSGTRDQRAAKLIAFREGEEFQPRLAAD